MGNIFTVRRGEEPDLDLSNGGTDVFFDVMTLASCARAQTPWQQRFALHFADGHRYSRGFAGFALAELPWTENAHAEHGFVLEVIETALERHGWGLLNYDPPFALGYLQTYRAMVRSFAPRAGDPSTKMGDWRIAPEPELVQRCPKHDIFVGVCGCRLCDEWLQPAP